MTGDNSLGTRNEVEAMRETAADLGVLGDTVLGYKGFSTWDCRYRTHEGSA